MSVNYAPGMQLESRDAESRIRTISRTIDGDCLIICEGLSELVRGREGRFLTILESYIRIHNPRKTHLIDDPSSGYQAGLHTPLSQDPGRRVLIRLEHWAALK